MPNVYIEPYHSARREIERLEEINAELLKALNATLKHIDDDMNNRQVVLWKLREAVLAALARAARP